MARHEARERTQRDRNRSAGERGRQRGNGREQERERGSQHLGYYDDEGYGGEDWRSRGFESGQQREGHWRPAEYGEDDQEHFPWGGGAGPVRWSERHRRGGAGEEDWKNPEQIYDERTRNVPYERGHRGSSGTYGQSYAATEGRTSYGEGRAERSYGTRGTGRGPWSQQGTGPWGSQAQGSWGQEGRGSWGSRGEGYWGEGQGSYGQSRSSSVRGMGGSYEGMQRPRGEHYGRGPKGYKRSDERIREDVNEALYTDEDIDASEIEVKVQDGEVTLSGSVDSRHAKRMAEDAVWSVSGVRNVTIMLKVDDERGSSSQKDGGRTESSDKNKKTTTGVTGS